LVYLIAITAWVHFIWQARSDIGEMVVYGLVIAGLLVLRWKWGGVQGLVPFAKG
jgi:sulfoxide reductase heme-binding subunit YedZ